MNHSNQKVYHNGQHSAFKAGERPRAYKHLPAEVLELLQQQKALEVKIRDIDNRLRFGYSEPLYDYKMQLVKEDLVLSCEVNQRLLKLSTKNAPSRPVQE